MTAQTRHLMRRLGAAALALGVAFGVSISPAHGAASPAPTRFVALDGGAPVLPHIKVTALTQGPSGTLYAAGVYVVRNTNAYAASPVKTLGSAWLVSQDGGATWARTVSTTDPATFPASGVAPWTNHRALPIDFTAMGIAIDPHNADTIYVAGCVDIDATCSQPTAGPGGHLVVRSTDGGQTWQDVLTTNMPIVGVGAKPLGATLPSASYSLLVDPGNSRRLYAAVQSLGVLRSEDAGRTWLYVRQPQSNYIERSCELLVDPQNPRVVYDLAREGTLYRTTDAGAHWQTRALLAGQLRTRSVTSLTWVGRSLYLTAARGLYASVDAGAHWRLLIPSPQFGDLTQSIRGTNAWISVLETTGLGVGSGLYATLGGSAWRLMADTTLRGPKYYGALDFQAIGTYLATRLWEDHAAKIIFTSAPLGGLYRWQTSV